jgi:hypothetical protein
MYITRHASPHKYKNRRSVVGGIKYDSKKEGRYAAELEIMRRAGEIREWSPKPRFTLFGQNGHAVCTHIPDFFVTLPDGSQEVHEVKSSVTMTPVWNLKRKLFEDNYPDITYRVVL